MELRWLGDSCVCLCTTQATVLCDPYAGALAATTSPLAADIVTLSGGRSPAVALRPLVGEPRIVHGPGEYELRGVVIYGFAVPRVSDLVRNTLYRVELDGIVVCHMPCLDTMPSAAMIQAIGDVDVVLIPIGGEGTLRAPQAAEVVSQVEPKLVVPMLWHSLAEEAPLQRFCRELGMSPPPPLDRLIVTKRSLPDAPQVATLALSEAPE